MWPVTLRGVTETLVATPGPNDRFNLAALGIHAPDAGGEAETTAETEDDSEDERELSRATPWGRTWGRTRTRRNFEEREAGYVQFTRDPVVFVDAALSIHEEDDPVLDSADAWVQVRPERLDSGQRGDTEWVDWSLQATDSEVRRKTVPTFSRGYAAVVEATVAASRLDVDTYDTASLRSRIRYFEGVVDRCGGKSAARAIEHIYEHIDMAETGTSTPEEETDIDREGPDTGGRVP